MQEYIIQFQDNINMETRKYIVESNKGIFIKNLFNNFDIIQADKDIAIALNGYDEIISIEENTVCSACEQIIDYSLEATKVKTNAIDKNYAGDDIVIAIIDSGINYNHVDLQMPIYKCARILDGSIKSVNVLADVIDEVGHGTKTSSVIFSQNNDVGYLGVAPNSKLMVIKATQPGENTIAISDLALAITWAVDNGANVINISYSHNILISVIKSACEYAYINNVSVVAPVGNKEDSTNGIVGYWAGYKGVVVVGAIVNDDYYSHYGKKINRLPNHNYPYELIFYRPDLNRYTLIQSKEPITIEANIDISTYPLNQYPYRLLVKPYFSRFNHFPIIGDSWEEVNSRHTSEFSVYIKNGASIIYANYNIIDNIQNTILNTENNINEYYNHLTKNYGGYYPDYQLSENNLVIADYSARGSGIDFVAPCKPQYPTYIENDRYVRGWGTSYSAPFIAGQIAIIRQKFPNITIDGIYNFLVENAITIGDGDVEKYGNGLVVMPNLGEITLGYFNNDTISKIIFNGQEITDSKFV